MNEINKLNLYSPPLLSLFSLSVSVLLLCVNVVCVCATIINSFIDSSVFSSLTTSQLNQTRPDQTKPNHGYPYDLLLLRSRVLSSIHGLSFTNPLHEKQFLLSLSPKMATLQETRLDLESGGGTRRQSTTTSDGDGGSRSSDAATEIVEGRESCVSDFSVVDLESGGAGGVHGGDEGSKVHLSKIERDCRICHLSLDLTNNQDSENGIPIELGCSCKDDLAAAHKHCAEAWFKIKGNKTCEICGSIAQNVAGANEAELMEQWNDANDVMSTATAHGGTTTATSDTRNFWQGHRFLNFLLACMVFAFVISWLFHFNVPS